MPVKAGDFLAGAGTPDLNGLIQAGRSDAFAVWRPGQGGNSGGMTAIYQSDGIRSHIRYTYRALMPTGDNMPSLRRPRDCIDGGRGDALGCRKIVFLCECNALCGRDGTNNSDLLTGLLQRIGKIKHAWEARVAFFSKSFEDDFFDAGWKVGRELAERLRLQRVVMTANGSSPRGSSSAEQRAEEVMQRVASDGSRILSKVFGRVREEVEDIVAEARTMHQRSGGSQRK